MEKVDQAIAKAQKGIVKYLAIQNQVRKVDVSKDRTFQNSYNGFYRVKCRSADWYQTYYEFMEHSKRSSVDFEMALDHIHTNTGRCEASFASKLVATLDPSQPVWDIHVLRNLGKEPPATYSVNKLKETKECYKYIQDWYQNFLQGSESKEWIRRFDLVVDDHGQIEDLKKIDFILWQMR